MNVQGHREKCSQKALKRLGVKDREWMEKNTVGCPKCGFRYEKSEGCNHMICYKCMPAVHFCYLCGSQLNPQNPFEHYNNPQSLCNNRLYYRKSAGKEDSKDATDISFDSSGPVSDDEIPAEDESAVSLQHPEENKLVKRDMDEIASEKEEIKEEVIDEDALPLEEIEYLMQQPKGADKFASRITAVHRSKKKEAP